MNNIKQKFQMSLAVLSVAALLVSVAPALPAHARAVIPQDVNGQRFANPSMIGCKPARAEFTTSAVQVVMGSGFLYWLAASGTAAAAGAGSMAFDTAVASTITDFVATARSISPFVFATGNATASVNGGLIGRWDVSNAPIRFESGLVFLNSANTHNALGCYRLDTGLNP